MYREIAHEERREREPGEDRKVDLREKGEWLMAKARDFAGIKADARYVGFYTYVRALTRVVSVIQAQTESQRLNEF